MIDRPLVEGYLRDLADNFAEELKQELAIQQRAAGARATSDILTSKNSGPIEKLVDDHAADAWMNWNAVPESSRDALEGLIVALKLADHVAG
jgi:hypothetical protein